MLPLREKYRILEMADSLLNTDNNVCDAHLGILSKKITTTCANPFKAHAKIRKGKYTYKGRRLAEMNHSSKVETFQRHLKPGDTLCQSCHRHFASLHDSLDMEELNIHSETDDSEQNYSEHAANLQTPLSKLNQVLQILNIPEINFGRRNESQQEHLIRHTIQEVESNLLSLFNLETKPSIQETNFDKILQRCQDKVSVTNNRNKCKIVSLFSGILTTDEIIRKFNVTRTLAENAKQIYRKQGILEEPLPKKGKTLDDEVKAAVQKMFEDDEYSRVSPNKRDSKEISPGNYQAKRTLLMSAMELYEKFKDTHPDMKIGLSKFKQLRPQHVHLLGNFKREFCVCSYCDNLDMMFEAIGIRRSWNMLELLVCENTPNKKQCMFGRCKDCLVSNDIFVNSIKESVSSAKPELLDMGVKFKQWIRVGSRDSQIELTMEFEEFVEYLINKCRETLKHIMIRKTQSSYQKFVKSNLDDETLLVQCDFAENFATCYPKETQALHFDKDQTTLHPFVVTAKKDDGSTETKNVVLFSDTVHHTTNTFYAFQIKFIEWVKENYPKVKKIVYFSDGAGSQYKNFKHFTNIRFHLSDFGLVAVHHFFASCHGKGPCDGIGGTTKAMIRKASFAGELLQTAQEVYQFAKRRINSIIALWISDEEIEEIVASKKLQERYESSQKMPKIRPIHRVQATPEGRLQLFELSTDEAPAYTVELTCERNKICNDFDAGDFVSAIYDGVWYYGKVISVDSEEGEVEIHFLKNAGHITTVFSEFENRAIHVPISSVITKVPNPRTNRKKGTFSFSKGVQKMVQSKLGLQ